MVLNNNGRRGGLFALWRFGVALGVSFFWCDAGAMTGASNFPESGMELAIDAASPGTPISPLLFGQNLEVTRRAIWSGLAAEMVANRKFAAVREGRPKRWQSGPGTELLIDPQRAFVGKGSARLRMTESGGAMIQQEESLAFREGEIYVFRWQLRTEERRRVRMRVLNADGSQTRFQDEMTLEPDEWQTWTGQFAAPATDTNARLEIGGDTPGELWIGAASVQPKNAFHGMRRDVIALLKELKPGSLRFPGGCYAEFYQWRDGLLPADQRPPIGPTALPFLLPDSDDCDTQELGIDEFIDLCREVGCEPAITLRMSEVPVEDSAALAEYCNGGPESKWGGVRTARGRPDPCGVKLWFLGNELYAFGRGGLNEPNTCAAQTRRLAEVLRKLDPAVRLVGCSRPEPSGDWNKIVFADSEGLLDLRSFHNYLLDSFKPVSPQPGPFGLEDMEAIAKAPTQALLPKLQAFHDAMNIPAIFDEWNTMWGRTGDVGMGIHAAGVLNLLCREADSLGIMQAFYFQPMNEGCVRISPLTAGLDSAGQVFAAFGAHQGNLRLKSPPVHADADVDVCASISPDGRRLIATIINRSATQDHKAVLSFQNLAAGRCSAVVTFLVAEAVDQAHSRFIERTERPLVLEDHRVGITLPRYSLVRLILSSEARIK